MTTTRGLLNIQNNINLQLDLLEVNSMKGLIMAAAYVRE